MLILMSLDTTKIWNSNPYTGQLRIVGGTYSNQGCLEVYCNGQCCIIHFILKLKVPCSILYIILETN